MKKILPFTLAVGMLLFGCSGSSQDSAESIVDIDQFTTYKVDIKSTPISFFDLIDEVEFVRLEETPESLLGRLGDLRLSDDFMFFSGGRGEIFLFNHYGEFIRTINHKGNGPEEYRYISEFWIDEYLNIYDGLEKRILQYDLSGNYVGFKRLMLNGDYVLPYKGGFVVDLNLSPRDSANFNLVLLDSGLEQVGRLGPFYEEKIPRKITTYRKSLTPYADNLLYHKNMNDTIFMLEDNNLRPLVTYDFGNDWVWTNESITSNPLAIREATMDNLHVWNSTSKIDENYIFMKFQGGNRLLRNVLINRLSGTVQLLDTRKSVDTNYSLLPVRWHEGRLAFSISSTDLAEFLKELGGDKANFKGDTTLEEVESAENPVLMWVKFKAGF